LPRFTLSYIGGSPALNTEWELEEWVHMINKKGEGKKSEEKRSGAIGTVVVWS